MLKKYIIEVPLYAWPVEHLAKINARGDISITVFGGFPDSPFNGGRTNFSLDGLLCNRTLFRISDQQLKNITAKFFETVSKINECGMSFCVVFTNIFVSPGELTAENLSPIQWLIDSSKKHGVKNGVILNNELLEEYLREKYSDDLIYISSCTKYVSATKMLSPQETLSMYQQDSAKYDFVVLTPQDSRRENLLKKIRPQDKPKIIAIANSYCSNGCNAYFHYECTSKMNKLSLTDKRTDLYVLAESFKFVLYHIAKCSAFWHIFFPIDVVKIARMQLNAGIVNFKLGRGIGVESLDKLAALIRGAS